MVSTLRRVPFGRTQKEPKGPRPIVRPSLRSGSLAPALLRGPAATGHPWPIAALPASMPVDPLRRTSSRPPGRAGRSKALRPEAADRPACSVRVYCAISVDTLLQVKPYCGSEPARERPSRAGSLPQLQCSCSSCRGTKAAFGVMRHSDEVVAKSGNGLCQLHQVLRVYGCLILFVSLER